MESLTRAAWPLQNQDDVSRVRAAVRQLATQAGLELSEVNRADRLVAAIGSRWVDPLAGRSILVGPPLQGPALDLWAVAPTSGLEGLPAIDDLGQLFDSTSLLGDGSCLYCRFGVDAPASDLDVGGLTVALSGETECGDAWDWAREGQLVSILLADGLGHGPAAALASKAAVVEFRKGPFRSPVRAIGSMHEALRRTQGAVIGLVLLDLSGGELTYAGVGNICARVIGPQSSRSILSTPGVVGFRLPKIRQDNLEWGADSAFILYTDGLRSSLSWDGLQGRSSALVAGALYGRFNRGTDDCGVVVVQGRPA